MRKFIWFSLFVPFVTFGADCPNPDGCYTDRVTFEIMNAEGKVVDKTIYDRLQPLSYAEVMALKYMRMIRHTEGGADTFLRILGAGGDGKQALEKQLQP